MTEIRRDSFLCSVCFSEINFSYVSNSIMLGYSDLDSRPAELKRSTMPLWVQECPVCGYANKTIEQIPPVPVNRRWLNSNAYKNCEGIPFENDLAKKFYHKYMVCNAGFENQNALDGLICAVWACDDAGEAKNAKTCRLIAADLAEEMYHDDKNPEHAVKLADLLRRAGEFDEMMKRTWNIRFSKETEKEKMLGMLLTFERRLAASRDARCYTIGDALKAMHYSEE